MMLRSIAMMTLDSTSTKVKAAPMPKAFETEVVSARVEQVPSTRRRTGFALMIPLVRMRTLETFDCAIVLFQPPLCELVVAVDAVVDGGKEGVGGVGRAGHGIVALALGDVGLGGQPVELGQVVGQGHVGADAAGLARGVHMDAGHGAGGVKADDDVDHAAVVAALGGLGGDGAVGGADGAGDAGGGVVGNFLQ